MPDNECDVPAEYSQVLAFNTSFKGLLSEDKFIARSDYKHLIEKYKRLFDFFKVLESSNLLNDYIKKHKLDEAQIIYFSNYRAQNEMYMSGDRKKREKICRSKGCACQRH